MKIDESKFRKVHGYEEGKEVLDAGSLEKAAEYKKTVLKNYTPIYQTQIRDKFRGEQYYVSRKYDGEYAIIFYSEGQTVTVNRSGRTRRGIPCIEEAGRLIAAAGIRKGIFPAEIYVEADYKTRVNDLIHALAHEEQIGTLRLAVFDIIEIDGRKLRNTAYDQTVVKLREIFGGGILCHDADYEPAHSAEEIEDLWRRWVEEEGSEGLVIHTRTPYSFKIKPRHFFDAVVIAYGAGSGNETEQVRRMLFAFMPGPDRYLIMSRVGSGLNEPLRRELFSFFEGKEVPNPVVGLNNKWDDLIFVRPEMVIEVAVEEIVTEMASGEKTSHLIRFDGDRYIYEGVVPGYRTYTPVFIRIREDKSPDENDAGTGQVTRFLTGMDPAPKSRQNELMYRDVLSDRQGNTISFIIWNTPDGYALYHAVRKDKASRREIIRSSSLYELFNYYQRSAAGYTSAGFVRDSSCTISTALMHYVMENEYEECY